MLLSICTDPEGGTGSGPSPLKIHKNKVFLRNTGSDPLKVTRLPRQHSMSGPLIALFGSSHQKKKKKKKNVAKLDPLWQNFLDPRVEVYSINVVDSVEVHSVFFPMHSLVKKLQTVRGRIYQRLDSSNNSISSQKNDTLAGNLA